MSAMVVLKAWWAAPRGVGVRCAAELGFRRLAEWAAEWTGRIAPVCLQVPEHRPCLTGGGTVPTEHKADVSSKLWDCLDTVVVIRVFGSTIQLSVLEWQVWR